MINASTRLAAYPNAANAPVSTTTMIKIKVNTNTQNSLNSRFKLKSSLGETTHLPALNVIQSVKNKSNFLPNLNEKSTSLVDPTLTSSLNLTDSQTILNVKQKYKMYLDWLNENSLKLSNANDSRQTNASSQLNWYNYERNRVNSDENRYLLKYLDSLNIGDGELTTTSSTHFEAPSANIKTKESKRKEKSSKLQSSTIHRHRKGEKVKKRGEDERPQSLNRENAINAPTTTNTNSMQTGTSVLESLTNFNSSINSSTQQLFMLMEPSSTNQAKLTSDSKLLSSKGVKFDKNYLTLRSINQANTSINNRNGLMNTPLNQNNQMSNGSTDSSSIMSNPVIKPILKASQQTNNNNNNLLSSSSTNQLMPTLRRVSNSSSGSQSISTGKNTQLNDRLASKLLLFNLPSELNETKAQQVKLPPIAKCSDDFYAVLNAMEKEKPPSL